MRTPCTLLLDPPLTLDWGGTDVREKEKNAFLLVRLSVSLGYTITNLF